MTNKEVAQAFVKGTNFASSGHMFVDGNKIYSYGKHYVIAKRVSELVYCVNDEKYSRTTSRHVSIVKNAITNHGGWIVPLEEKDK